MRERPILFSAPMVLALLAGRKTQTRRIVKPGAGQKWLKPDTLEAVARWAPSKDGWWTMAVGAERRIVHCGHEMDGGHIGSVRCPYGKPGDRLWVRETWRQLAYSGRDLASASPIHEALIEYAADRKIVTVRRPERTDTGRLRASGEVAWKPSIFMPRWASRITLEVTGVRVERLQDIDSFGAVAEGVTRVSGDLFGVDGAVEFCHHYPEDAFADLWRSINGDDSWKSNPWVWVVEFRRAA